MLRVSTVYYQKIEGQYIAWKAVTSSQPDAVMVIPEDASMNLSDVHFEVNTSVLQPQNNGDAIKLSVQGKAAGMVEELIASTGGDEQAEVIGKLNLVSYDQLNKKVVIVPVNNAQLPSSLTSAALTEKLTTIFSQAVVSVQVKIDSKITVTLGDEFDDGESGLLSNYTGDMKKVINAYGQLQNETYYLFLVENPRSGNTALGYMPRSKQAGFIFVDNHGNNPERIVRTMAHELSHGMFNLKHTFSEFTALSRGTTQNLMDYSPTGTELLKYQWDYVHDPQTVIPLFEGDEEGKGFCNWWYQNVTSLFFDTEQDTQLEERQSLFQHVHENFDTYFTASKTNNKEIPGFAEWSARKSSFTVRENLTLVERIVNKFLNTPSPTFVLHDKGIFLGKFEIQGSEYKVCVYSEHENISLAQVQVEDLCDLVDHESTRIVIDDGYILISFFKEAQLQMVLQIMADEDEDAELWLTYMNILKKGPSVLEQVKAYWNSLWADSTQQGEKTPDFLSEILPASLSDQERDAYANLLTLAKSSSGAQSSIQSSDWVTDQTWLYNSEFYSSGEIVLNETGEQVSVKDVGQKRQCWEATKMMIENAGYVSGSSALAYQLAVEHKTIDKMVYHSREIENAIKCIFDHLGDGRPIQVGVHYAYNKGINWDKSTDHWMVISGMKFEKEYYFEFYDPGTSYSDKGYNSENRLYLSKIDGVYVLKGQDCRGNKYIVTEIRPNGDAPYSEGAHNVAIESKEPCDTKFCF